MDESSAPTKELEELEDHDGIRIQCKLNQKVERFVIKGPSLLGVRISDADLENILSDFTDPSDIDKKLSELQCPFTWKFPHEGYIPLSVVPIASVAKEFEDNSNFKLRDFIRYILQVYELCNGGKLDRANDVMLYARVYLEKFNSNCEEEFFISMKKPLQHIFHSCQIHLLKARFSEKLLSKPEVYIREALKILCIIHPYSQMTDVEQAGIHGCKAQVFSEYCYRGLQLALECAKRALELDPSQSEWYYLTGKIMGKIRRQAYWNDYVREEEIKMLERAIELYEKPSYMMFLATAYIDSIKTIYRNLHVDREMSNKLNEMNNRAKQLFRRCIELCPDCPLVRTVCANGLLKIPKFADKEFVDECLKFALEKLPHDPAVHHAAGMCAERLVCNFEKALDHYEIAGEYLYGARADFIRLQYACDKEYDFIGALEKMLESWPSPLLTSHTTLSYIGSYYLFLKKDLVRALQYYERIMDDDLDSSAITASKPLFLNMKTPVNIYPILCTEIHLKLQQKDLSNGEVEVLETFLRKLNQIDPDMSKKYGNKPSRIQKIINESDMLSEKYKAIAQKKREQNIFRSYSGNMSGNTRSSRGRDNTHGQGISVRRQSNSSDTFLGSWRNVQSNPQSCREASIFCSWREKDNEIDTNKSKELNSESGDSVGQKKQDSCDSGHNAGHYRRQRTYSNDFKRNDHDNCGLNTNECGRQRTYSNDFKRNDHDSPNCGLSTKDCGRQRTYSNDFKENDHDSPNCGLSTEDSGRQRTYSNDFKRNDHDSLNCSLSKKYCGRQRTYSNDFQRNDHDNCSLNSNDCGRQRTYSNDFKKNDYNSPNCSLSIKHCGRQRTYSNDFKRNDHDNCGLNTKDCGRQRTYSNEFKRNDNEHLKTKCSGRQRTYSNDFMINKNPDQQHDKENRSSKFQKNRIVQTIRNPYGPYEGGIQKSFERKRVPDMKWVKE